MSKSEVIVDTANNLYMIREIIKDSTNSNNPIIRNRMPRLREYDKYKAQFQELSRRLKNKILPYSVEISVEIV